MSRRFIALCAGLGGSRSGLEAAGWECSLAVDSDSAVCQMHRLAFGDCEHQDVHKIASSDLPAHEMLFCGLPDTPFPLSIPGYSHQREDHPFEGVKKVLQVAQSELVVLESTSGVLRRQGGYAWARVIKGLIELGYTLQWVVIDASWLGIPQSRKRLVAIATRSGKTAFSELSGAITNGLARRYGQTENADIDSTLDFLTPKVGKPRNRGRNPFCSVGYASGHRFLTAKLQVENPDCLQDVNDVFRVADYHGDDVRSVRYYSRGERTRPHLRHDPIAHTIGPKLSAAPLFAVPKKRFREKQFTQFLQNNANWSREDHGHIVFRLTPEFAIRLFGPQVESIAHALGAPAVAASRKYQMLGNLAIPEVMRLVGEYCLSRNLGSRRR